MKVAVDKLCYVFSHALDIIEEEQIGASERHSMRTAVLCAAMGRHLGFGDDALSAISLCALFHDNALTEYNLSKLKDEQRERNLVMHCEKGQSNVASWLPFRTNIDGFILYHHERGNGEGPFRKREGEYPLEAALIAAADMVDVTYHLQRVHVGELQALRNKIVHEADKLSTRPAINALLEVLNEDMLEKLRDENIAITLEQCLPRFEADMDDPMILRLAKFVSRVVDFKSEFTQKHTSQIANRAWVMANHYGYSREERAALFLAASLHDIGKIATPLEILEKPGALDADEYVIIKQHVRHTDEWLSQVPNFELIRRWAADHHEKLNGIGYSRGKKGDELDFNSRLIACLDIYQAVSEPRPYHRPRAHAKAMELLYDMAGRGQIDEKIVKDLDMVMEKYSLREVPSPLDDVEVSARPTSANQEHTKPPVVPEKHLGAKEVLKQWVIAFNAADVERLANLYADNAVNHQIADEPVTGREAIRAGLARMFDTAKMICVVENMFEDGEWAMMEWKDPKGSRGCGFFHVIDGKIVFQRGYCVAG